MKLGVKKAFATATMATMAIVGTAGTASALTWEDVIGHLFGDSSTSSTTQDSTKDSGEKEQLGNGEVSKMLSELREAVPGQDASSVVTEAEYRMSQGEDVPKYVRKEYDRGGWKSIKQAGFDWGDIPNTCNTRKASLIAHGENVQYDEKGCKITDGQWVDKYGSGEKYDASSNTKMDIDHIVALGAVHVSGGWNLSDEDKFKVANDPDNLVPVSNSLNRQKSDQNADTWLPTGDYLCEYVTHQVMIKDKYDLSVTGAEKERLGEELQKCGR